MAGFVALVVASAPLRAEEPAEAETTDGKGAADSIEADLAAGRFKEACSALKQRYLQEERPVTLFRLAECYEKWGRIATAAATYDDYLAAYDKLTDSQQKEERRREEIASKQREVLEARVPKVILRLPRDAPSDTVVKRRPFEDGPLVAVAVGIPLPIDPGEHVLTTEVPGRASALTKFTVQERDKRNIDVEVPSASDKIEPTNRLRPVEPKPSLLPPLDPGISGRRVAAYSLGAVGALGLLGGVVTGVITWAQKEPIATNCKPWTDPVDKATKLACNDVGVSAKETAGVTGILSSILFPVGVVALGTGITLYLTEPPPSRFGAAPPQLRVGTAVGVGAASLEVDVRW